MSRTIAGVVEADAVVPDFCAALVYTLTNLNGVKSRLVSCQAGLELIEASIATSPVVSVCHTITGFLLKYVEM